jgi:hypothetical protein
MICVLIAGEGPNEIGDGTSPGAIQALLEKIRPHDWKIRRSLRWKDVRKLRTNTPGDGDVRTVEALFLLARESGCNALVFLCVASALWMRGAR